jgi:hypothetical protein
MSTGSTKITLTSVTYTTILTILEGLIGLSFDSSITDEKTQEDIKTNIIIIQKEMDIIRLDTSIPRRIQKVLNSIKDSGGKAEFIKRCKAVLKTFIDIIQGYMDTFNTVSVTVKLFEVEQLKIQTSLASLQTKITLILK